jgi:phenylalanyl-tRNA synthetase beta chain
VVGKADLLEEVTRVYGYDRIPETQIADAIPPQYGNPEVAREHSLKGLLVNLGLQEVVTYRQTSPEKEARILPPDVPGDQEEHVHLANPIASDKVVMRRSLLAGLLEILEHNLRFRERIAVFEIGPVFLPLQGQALPEERAKLAIAMTGPREPSTWKQSDRGPMDFYDLKGVLEALVGGLHLSEARFVPALVPTYHPGKSARLLLDGDVVGDMGVLHPLVQARFELSETPVLAARLDLALLFQAMPARREVQAYSTYPPVLEDLAFVVDEQVTAGELESAMLEAGGDLLTEVRLFDLFRGSQVGEGKKSLAYALTYQAPDRTLTDAEVEGIRARIVSHVKGVCGGELRK